jgi:hypothetical protein
MIEGNDRIVRTYELKNADQFIPVIRQEGDDTVIFYGGDQAWYKTRIGRYSGCGAVAAADIFAYLAMRDPSLKSLFNNHSPEISVEVFLKHMDEVIRYVAPLSFNAIDMPYGGLTSIPKFTRYCEEYAASRGVKLKGSHFSFEDTDIGQASGIVAEQLAKDNPLALLIMQNRKLKKVRYTDAFGKPVTADMRYHWVVITAMRKQAGSTKITVSSEGGKAELDFADVWNGGESFMGPHGIVYFDVNCLSAQTTMS